MAFYVRSHSGISMGDPIIEAEYRERGFEVIETLVRALWRENIFVQVEGGVHWLKIGVERMEVQVFGICCNGILV